MIKTLKFLFLCLAISTFLNGGPVMADEKDIIHLTLKDGVVKIETRPDLAHHCRQTPPQSSQLLRRSPPNRIPLPVRQTRHQLLLKILAVANSAVASCPHP